MSVIVADLAALKALTTSDVSAGALVQMVNRTSTGDRGGGSFQVFSGPASNNQWIDGKAAAGTGTGSQMVADNGMVVQNTAATLTFVRILEGPINTAWYGTDPAATASDNTTAFNDAFNFARSRLYNDPPQGNPDENSFAYITPTGVYAVNSLRLTGLRNSGSVWDLCGSTLVGKQADSVILDCLLSRHWEIRNGNIRGDASTPPRIGLQRGYSDETVSSSYVSLKNVNFDGYFTLCCVYSGGSEECFDQDCQFRNEADTAGSYCEIRDAMNWFGRRSEYVSGSQLARDISGISQANPGVVTAPGHNFPAGTKVRFGGVGGMTNLNGNVYTVQNPTTDTFELADTDTSGFPAFTGGGDCWKTDAYSYVNHKAANVSWFKPYGGPALCIAGPVNQHDLNSVYAYARDSEIIQVIFCRSVSELDPNNIRLFGQLETAVETDMTGSALPTPDCIAFVRAGDWSGDIRTTWDITLQLPHHNQSLISTNTASGNIHYLGSIQISNAALSHCFGVKSDFRMTGYFSTRDFSGIAPNCEAFDGTLHIHDPDSIALPAGAYEIISETTHATGGAHRFKGPFVVRAGTAEVGSGNWTSLAEFRVESDRIKFPLSGGTPGSVSEGSMAYDDTGNQFLFGTNTGVVGFPLANAYAPPTWTGAWQWSTGSSVAFNGMYPLFMGPAPGFDFYETDQGENLKRWRLRAIGGNFNVQTGNDDGTFKANILDVDPAGNLNIAGTYKIDGSTVVSNQQAAIASLTDNTGASPGNNIDGIGVLTDLTDSTGATGLDASVDAVGDTSTSDQSSTINKNFAEIVAAIEALQAAVSTLRDNDSSTADKSNAILAALRAHGLIAT